MFCLGKMPSICFEFHRQYYCHTLKLTFLFKDVKMFGLASVSLCEGQVTAKRYVVELPLETLRDPGSSGSKHFTVHSRDTTLGLTLQFNYLPPKIQTLSEAKAEVEYIPSCTLMMRNTVIPSIRGTETQIH